MRQSPSQTHRHRVEVAGVHGGSFESGDAASLEDTVEDGFGKVGVVQNAPPELKRRLGGEDRRATAAVALIDDIEENVDGVVSVGEAPDFRSLCRDPDADQNRRA